MDGYLNKDNYLKHYGVKGMRWGVRKDKYQNGKSVNNIKDPLSSTKEKILKVGYSTAVKMAPREVKYKIKRQLNRSTEVTQQLSNISINNAKLKGTLSTSKKIINAIEKEGIEKHKKARYNLNDKDISKLKTYTDSARYSRSINGYLAIGEPKNYAHRAESLKNVLRKTSVTDTVLYRSCNIKYSFDGVSNKLKTMSEKELASAFDSFSRNYKGKSFKENRIFSTSTSPNFAIDTWRKVNPTAAKTYNTYMIINTENCPGLLADGRTNSGKKLVNTRSNQEGILAPDRMKYESLSWDAEREMFAIQVTAMGGKR